MLHTPLLPGDEDLSRLLSELFGRPVAAAASVASVAEPVSVAVYAGDDGEPGVIVLLDLALSAASGAALSLVPAGVADDSVRSGVLTPTLADNLQEVLNVCAQLLNRPGAPHLVLHEVHAAGRGVPSHVAHLVDRGARRAEFEVTIPPYGGGRLAILAV